MARDTWPDLRFALMATMTIIRTLVPPMDFTGRAILSGACLSAQAPGITAIMGRDITGVLTMAVGTTVVGTTAGVAIGAMAMGGDMAIGEATVATTVGDAATEAGATATDSTAGEVSMAVAGSTVVADSTADMAVAGNYKFSVEANRKVGVMAPAFGVCWRLAVGSRPNTVGLAPEALPRRSARLEGFFPV